MNGAGAVRGHSRTAALRAVAELRLRLTLRRLKGKGGVPDAIARVVLLVMAVPVGVICAVGTGAAAYGAVHGKMVGFATGGLFFGIWSSWTAIGLSLSDRESFDLRRMLVYPVTPALTWTYELLAGLIGDPFSMFWSFLLAGALAGAGLARPGGWVLLLALVHLLFALGTVCLVSLLQELLARALRVRRVREVGVAAIYLGCLLVLLHVGTGGLRGLWRLMGTFYGVRWLVYPPALADRAAGLLYNRELLAALPWIAAQAATLALTAWASYRLALADALAGAEGVRVRGDAGGSGWPIPGRVGPILEKELKYLLRHPLMAVLALVIPGLAAILGWAGLPLKLDGAQELLAALPLFAFALYTLLVTQVVWINAFGWDRGGARLWFLAPVRPVDVLRAKNAAARVVALGIFAASALALFATGGLPPAWAILGALALHLGAGVWLVTAGNVVSILNGRPGSHALQRGASVAPFSALLGLGIVSGVSVLFLPPVLLEVQTGQPWTLFWGWCAVGLAGVAVRRAALPWTARLLERRREELLAAVGGDDA